MARNAYLKAVQKYVNRYDWTVHWVENDSIAIAENNSDYPFLIVTYDAEIFDGIYLSFAIDMVDEILISDLNRELSAICPIRLDDLFFIDDNGLCFFGEDAEKLYVTQTKCLLAMKVEGKYVH